VFNLTERGVENFKRIEIESPVKLIRLQANGVDDGLKLLSDNQNYYVELTLNLTEPMTPVQSSALHAHENLVSLRADVRTSETDFSRVSNKDKSSSELFSDYYKSRYGADVSKELLALFLSLTEEE
ncbi:MAG: hypothetical protein HDP34_05460, partial [Clostridia bacterium]|nr:hypothetical protein [Clostridia bacterium]